MILIGIAGKAGCGKDTVGEIFRRELSFRVYAFATPLKQMICTLLGVHIEQWMNREWREKGLPEFNGVSPRAMAQTIGTEWGRRTICPELWFQITMRAIDGDGKTDDVVITDVRFNNEAGGIRARDGYIIHVARNCQALDNERANHDSENGIDVGAFDFHITNDATVDALYSQVQTIYNAIVKDQQVNAE